MKKISLLGLFFLLMLFIGCSESIKEMETPYTIKITGSENQKFSGHYSFVDTKGIPKPIHVDAVVPMEYKGKGIAAVSVFRKTTAEGTLKVEILKDEKVVSSLETNQPFGVISLGKIPDTDSIINKILGIILG
ncbi:MAG: hypothetical protein HGB33_04355 [Syntrophaceae bacterium]|nr:hypothetical protein [Syntrophaceae bacterium]NTW77002.1 hypothetical protein [Syntrophaceae bacterium]